MGPVTVAQLVQGVSAACAAPLGRRELAKLRVLAQQEQQRWLDPSLLEEAGCMGEALGDAVFFEGLERRGEGRYDLCLGS